MDPDLGWHLRVGEQILKERAAPSLETYDYPLEGRTWVDHEWLINAASYWIYANFGYVALNVLFALMVVAALLVLNLIARKYAPRGKAFGIKNGARRGFHRFAPTFGRNRRFAAFRRPYAGNYFPEFVAFVFGDIRLPKERRLENIAVAAAAVRFLGQCPRRLLDRPFRDVFLGVCQIFGNTVPGRINGGKAARRRQNFRFFFFRRGRGRGHAFKTPYGTGLYSFLKYYDDTSYLSLIKEWLPFYCLPVQHWQLLFFALTAIAITVSLRSFLKNKGRRTPLWEIAASAVFLALALKSKRHFPLLFVVSFPFLVGFFASFFNPPDDSVWDKKWRKRFFIVKPYILAAFLIIIASKAIASNFVSDPFVYFKNKYIRTARLNS